MERLVFVVEDNPVQQKILKVHFEEALGDYRVKSFVDPDQMIGEISEKPFAIVLDHLFGGNKKTGIDYLKDLKKNHKSIPVIYYTTVEDEALKSEVLSLGAAYYIIKNSASFVYLRTALDELKEKEGKKSWFKRLFG